MKHVVISSLVCLVCLAPVSGQTPEIQAKLQTILYVQRLHAPSGGFLIESPDPKNNAATQPTLRATSTALQALKYLGGEIPNKEATARFVASCFDKKSGGFADLPGGKPEVFATSIALLAMIELRMPADTYHAPAVKFLAEQVKSFDDIRIAAAGLERIKAKSPKAKEWITETMALKLAPPAEEQDGKSRMIASQAVTLLRLGEQPKNAGDIVKYLQGGQRKDGAYCKEDTSQSDLEATYRVMRAFMMLKSKPLNMSGLREFIQKCRNADNGYGVFPGQPSTVSGTYYAAVIAHWLDEMK